MDRSLGTSKTVGLQDFVNNALSAAGDPDISVEILRQRLSIIANTLWFYRDRIAEHPIYGRMIVELMLRGTEMKKKIEALEVKVLKQEEEKDNIVPMNKPNLAIDNTIDGQNWLDRLPVRTVFACKDKRDGSMYLLPMFTVVHKSEKSVGLFSNDTKNYLRVHTNRFINKYDFVEILGFADEESEQAATPEEKKDE